MTQYKRNYQALLASAGLFFLVAWWALLIFLEEVGFHESGITGDWIGNFGSGFLLFGALVMLIVGLGPEEKERMEPQ